MQNYGSKALPKINVVRDLERELEPYRVVPPLEDINAPFILASDVGNGSSDDPIYITVSTHGLLHNAIEQRKHFPTFQQTDTYKTR